MPLFDLLEGDIHTLLRHSPPRPPTLRKGGSACDVREKPCMGVAGGQPYPALLQSPLMHWTVVDIAIRGREPERGPVPFPGDDTPLQSPAEGIPIHRPPALPTPPACALRSPHPGRGAVRGDIQWAAVPGSALTSVSRGGAGRASLDSALLRPVPEQWTVVDIAIRGGDREGEFPPRRGIPILLSGTPHPARASRSSPPPPGAGAVMAIATTVQCQGIVPPAVSRSSRRFPGRIGRVRTGPGPVLPGPAPVRSESWWVSRREADAGRIPGYNLPGSAKTDRDRLGHN